MAGLTLSGVGCVQTDDDISSVRLTTAVNPGEATYWKESIAMMRTLLRTSPNLSPTYRRIARRRLASCYWRLIRLDWSSGNLWRSVWHLPVLGWTSPSFVISLLAYRPSNRNRRVVIPKY